jgi:AcrR family transcriptional regulator
MSTKTDPRVKRTRQMLLEALLELVKEKNFQDITVQDIADKAGINRTTFYLHFMDKYDLITQNTKRLIDELFSQIDMLGIDLVSPQIAKETEPVSLVRLVENIAGQADFFRLILGRKGNPEAYFEIRNHFEKVFRGWLQKRFGNDPRYHTKIEIAVRYLSSSRLGLIEWWLESNQQISAKEFAHSAWQMTVGGVGRIFDEPD